MEILSNHNLVMIITLITTLITSRAGDCRQASGWPLQKGQDLVLGQ